MSRITRRIWGRPIRMAEPQNSARDVKYQLMRSHPTCFSILDSSGDRFSGIIPAPTADGFPEGTGGGTFRLRGPESGAAGRLNNPPVRGESPYMKESDLSR